MENKLGRPQVISKEEVLEVLEANDNHLTVPQMAELLEVHPVTIRKRLKELQEDGIYVLPAIDGYHFYADDIENIDDAAIVINAAKWSAGIMKSGLQIGTLAGRQLTRAVALMGSKLSLKQIRKLKKIYSMVSIVLQNLETEIDFDSLEDNSDEPKALKRK